MSQHQWEDRLVSHGHNVHYVRWGEKGPNVVILHSMGMDAHSMDLLAESLAGSHRVLSLTILGHGDSDDPSRPLTLHEHVEVMREAYTQLDFKPNFLIGHSVGGMMGMILAAEHPDDLNGLILVDIAPFESTGRPLRPPPPDRFTTDEALNYLKERYPKFHPYYIENRLTHAFVKGPDGHLRLKHIGDAIRPSLVTDLWPYVARVKTPTILVIGAESTLVTPEAISRMRSYTPRLEAVSIPGSTHMVPQDRPDEFETVVRGFIAKNI